jgi:hypothetical protein
VQICDSNPSQIRDRITSTTGSFLSGTNKLIIELILLNAHKGCHKQTDEWQGEADRQRYASQVDTCGVSNITGRDSRLGMHTQLEGRWLT